MIIKSICYEELWGNKVNLQLIEFNPHVAYNSLAIVSYSPYVFRKL